MAAWTFCEHHSYSFPTLWADKVCFPMPMVPAIYISGRFLHLKMDIITDSTVRNVIERTDSVMLAEIAFSHNKSPPKFYFLYVSTAPNARPFQMGKQPSSSCPEFWHRVFWHREQRLNAIIMVLIVPDILAYSHLSCSFLFRQFPSPWNLQLLKPHCGKSIRILSPPKLYFMPTDMVRSPIPLHMNSTCSSRTSCFSSETPLQSKIFRAHQTRPYYTHRPPYTETMTLSRHNMGTHCSQHLRQLS